MTGGGGAILKNLTVIAALVGITLALSLAWQALTPGAADLPSSYDPGLSLETAVKTSKKPLLIEFYSDDCGACRELTPVLHRFYRERLADRLTMVMIDVNRPESAMAANLFHVEAIPAIFVFDAARMKKTAIAVESLSDANTFVTAVNAALGSGEKPRS